MAMSSSPARLSIASTQRVPSASRSRAMICMRESECESLRSRVNYSRSLGFASQSLPPQRISPRAATRLREAASAPIDAEFRRFESVGSYSPQQNLASSRGGVYSAAPGPTPQSPDLAGICPKLAPSARPKLLSQRRAPPPPPPEQGCIPFSPGYSPRRSQ
jgi:hypothetical protein